MCSLVQQRKAETSNVYYIVYTVLLTFQVTAGSISSNSGLQAGDTILLINGMSTGPMRHTEAQQAIITAGNHLSLTIKRYADKSHQGRQLPYSLAV